MLRGFFPSFYFNCLYQRSLIALAPAHPTLSVFQYFSCVYSDCGEFIFHVADWMGIFFVSSQLMESFLIVIPIMDYRKILENS